MLRCTDPVHLYPVTQTPCVPALRESDAGKAMGNLGGPESIEYPLAQLTHFLHLDTMLNN